MNHADDAQREMEQRALRNVRGLLDKMEGQEQSERWSVRKLAVALGIVVVVFMIALAVMVSFVKTPGSTQSITLPPPPRARRSEPMLKIWGRLTSVNVQKVVWCSDELGLAYERIDAGGKFGVNDTPGYLAMNPNGLVPVIDDEGFVLYESNAIVRYLGARAGTGTLWPHDPRARADTDRWMDWQATSYTPAMWGAFWQLVRTPAEKRDAAAVEASRAKSEKLSAILDAHLAGRRYLCGETFTAGDIVVACAAHRWLNLPLERVARPNLERWYAELAARPASRQVTSQVPIS